MLVVAGLGTVGPHYKLKVPKIRGKESFGAPPSRKLGSVGVKSYKEYFKQARSSDALKRPSHHWRAISDIAKGKKGGVLKNPNRS